MRMLKDQLREALKDVDPDSVVLRRTPGNFKFNSFSRDDDTGELYTKHK